VSLGLLSHVELQEMMIGRIHPPTSQTRSIVVHHQKIETMLPFKKPSLRTLIKLTESYSAVLVYPRVLMSLTRFTLTLTLFGNKTSSRTIVLDLPQCPLSLEEV
jgi:hypothetical protein